MSDPLRRALDVAVSSCVLLVTAPLLAVSALLIRAEDGGPVIFRRRVYARGRVAFDAYKLRTMRKDAEALVRDDPALSAEYARSLKLKADPRITRVGAVLRHYSIDELPQLVNVVRGQMTLVGPRMIHPGELNRFGDFGERVLSVKPGLTGLWQVSGRQDLTFERRLELDREYLDRRSIWLDLRILARTLPAVVLGKGAY